MKKLITILTLVSMLMTVVAVFPMASMAATSGTVDEEYTPAEGSIAISTVEEFINMEQGGILIGKHLALCLFGKIGEGVKIGKAVGIDGEIFNIAEHTDTRIGSLPRALSAGEAAQQQHRQLAVTIGVVILRQAGEIAIHLRL